MRLQNSYASQAPRRRPAGGLTSATAAALAVLAAASAATPATAAPPPAPAASFSTGFSDAYLDRRVERDRWLRQIRTQGAQAVRVQGTWASTAPVRPPTWAAARDPEWPGYRFAALDDQVRRAVTAGLEPTLIVSNAPEWAEGPGRPGTATAGSWKPSSASFGRYMEAVAKRYSGTIDDPAVPGTKLPRVREFQLWNEPNLALYLAPQFEGGSPTSPAMYRSLQNAGYRAVKRVQPGATVITAGTSPFGDSGTTSQRMRPVAFWRLTLCLGSDLRRTCSSKMSADAVAHHPYPTDGPPSRPAYNRDDMSIADIPKLTRVLAAARRVRTVGPALPRIWVTEFGVRSNPPAPIGYGVRSFAEQARYDAEATWRLWRDGVSRLFYFTIVDEVATDGHPTEGHGVFTADGRPKPAALATRFPVYAYRERGQTVVWTRSPTTGQQRIEARRRGGGWYSLGAFSVRAGEPRTFRFRVAKPTAIRAVVGSTVSYEWAVR